MESILLKQSLLEERTKIEVFKKYKKQQKVNHLSKDKQKKELLYKFYKCDYCGDEIKILAKQYEQSGGIVILPRTLTKRTDLKLVLCNKCIRPVVKEYEKEFEEEHKWYMNF